MSGKSKGLNSGLRKLMARIQKDFDYPKVFAVKCSIATPIHTYLDQTEVCFHSVPPVTIQYRDGCLDSAVVCHQVTPMESLETRIHEEECWGTNPPEIHSMPLETINPQVQGFSLEDSYPPVRTRIPPVPSLTIRRGVPKPRITVRHNTGLARNLPVRLPLTPMTEIPMKLRIRYRSSVLKLLNLRPDQINFVGVVTGLPAAPVRMAGLEAGITGQMALAKVVGPPNALLGRRVWVIVQPHGRDHVMPITLKEE